jgi:hypothetical protein
VAIMNWSGLFENTISDNYLKFTFLKFGAKVQYKLILKSIIFNIFDGIVNFDVVYCLLFKILMDTRVSIAKKRMKMIKKLIFSSVEF